MTAEPTPTGPEATRQALIESGLRLFGDKGFAATSTREIAGAARANIASIAYHFGSKDGLRKAIAESIAGALRGLIDSAFEQAGKGLDEVPADKRGEAAATAIAAAIERIAQFLLASPMGALFPRFVVREMTEQSAAFDVLYSGVFEPAHRRLCALFAAATGDDPESEETRLTVFALIGPLLYFRIGAPAVQRRMGWATYGPAEARKISRVVSRLIAARIEQKAQKP